ncbi:MAG: DNA sulfur modification protein DndE [Promethearchaeota archaeon]
MALKFNRIKVSRSSTSKLSLLKRRTGLTPNLLCRMALCFSLEKTGLPPVDYTEDGAEFIRYTLTGEWDDLFVILLKERLRSDGIDFDATALVYLKAHLNRGISMIHSRVRNICDLEKIFSDTEVPTT